MINESKARSEFLADLMAHRRGVQDNLEKICMMSDVSEKRKRILQDRAVNHDKSKLENPKERDGYISMHIELIDVDYGTPEYKKITDKYKYAIDLHYKANSHHPEHYQNGYEDMSIEDKIEMVCDWCAAIKVRDGIATWEKNLEFNKKRFNIPDDEFEKIMNLARFVILDTEKMLHYPNFLDECEDKAIG